MIGLIDVDRHNFPNLCLMKISSFHKSKGNIVEWYSTERELYDRMYKLTDGTLVQRDWYSSYLLYCYDYRTQGIDKNKCITEFDKHYNKEKALITWIKANKIKILNSGIKVA